MTKKTMLHVGILLLFCLLLSNVTLIAQQAVAGRQGNNSKLPYINYKGIQDPETAKQEWVKDNAGLQKQEAFINYKGIQDPKEAKIAWLKDNPEKPVTHQPSVESMPFYNYNGIKDVRAAKAAWLKDNPNADTRFIELTPKGATK